MNWMQDVRYAIRQLRKAPGFTSTAMPDTGFGNWRERIHLHADQCDAAENLPVADPQTLVRIGDNTDCCVNSGAKRDGDYGLFSTETWRLIKNSTPEFED